MRGPVLHQSEAFHTTKNGVDMWIYNGKDDLADAAVAYQETATGHAEEFRHHKSAFVFFIIEGTGEWMIEGESFPVKAHDVVIVPAGKKFYYRGHLKQVCVTAPAWDAESEEHIRNVAL